MPNNAPGSKLKWLEVGIHKNVSRDCVKHVVMKRYHIAQSHDGFTAFRVGRDVVNDNPRTGRPHVENNTVQLLASLLDVDRRWTARELAAEVGVCHKTVLHILHDNARGCTPELVKSFLVRLMAIKDLTHSYIVTSLPFQPRIILTSKQVSTIQSRSIASLSTVVEYTNFLSYPTQRNPMVYISRLVNMKDPASRLASSSIYSIPCSCGLLYIGQMSRTVKKRNEHTRYCNSK
ncbi:hypothetical protein C0J52_02590 [Blattella germanica]|nr:hypothetical protein C0J52_02590 [Blattella germanica]